MLPFYNRWRGRQVAALKSFNGHKTRKTAEATLDGIIAALSEDGRLPAVNVGPGKTDASTDAWIHDGWQWKGGAGPTLCVTSPTSVLSWQGKRAGREQAVRGSAATGRSEFDPTPRAPAFDPTSPRTMAQLRVVWDLACEALGDVASAHEAAYAPHFDLPIRSAAAPPRSPPPPPPPAKSPAPRATPRTRARQRRKGRKVAAGSAGGSPRRVATAGGARGGTPTSAERRSAGRHSRARPVAPAAYASGTAMDLDDALARADVHI